MRTLRTPALLLLPLLWLACSSSSPTSQPMPTPNPTPTPAPTPTPTPSPAPTLTEIQNSILTPSCGNAGCHGMGSSTAGFNVDPGNTFANSVGVPSRQQPALLRVNPGNAEASYLVRKLEGGPGITGNQMPFGGTPLSAADIRRIRDWIAAGAQNN